MNAIGPSGNRMRIEPGARRCHLEYVLVRSPLMGLQHQTTAIVLDRLLIMTSNLDVFCHDSDYHILNNVTPCISQDIQNIT